MIYKFRINQLGCANCAQKMENLLNQATDFKAQVNFSQGNLTLESDQPMTPTIIQELEDQIQTIEKQVTLTPLFTLDREQTPTEAKISRLKWDSQAIRIIYSVLIFLMGFLANRPGKITPVLAIFFFAVSYLIIALPVLEKTWTNIKNRDWFDENFLMTIATLGAFLIGEYPEAIAVMVFYQIGELLQNRSVNQSRQSIQSLLAIRPDFVRVETPDGKIQQVDPQQIQIGDEIYLAVGDRLALDGKVIKGQSQVDTAAITGESLPVSLKEGQEIYSGSINMTAPLHIKVTKSFEHSTVNQIIQLVEEASSKKASTEKFITRFAKVYTPIVVALAIATAILPHLWLADLSWRDSLYRALQFLVISCPCALVISVPMSFFAGLGAAAKEGILIKGGNYLEVLNQVDQLILDKTGTLTQGNFAIDQIHPVDLSEADFLDKLAHIESQSNHPIAQSILKAYPGTIDTNRLQQVETRNGKGLAGQLDGQVIAAGNTALMTELGIEVPPIKTAATVIHLALQGKYAGYVLIKDQIKKDSAKAIDQLHQVGMKSLVLLSGDKEATVQEVAQTLKIDQAHGEMLPQDKLAFLEDLLAKTQATPSKIAFVGDGINDAPALSRADLGIAMGALGADAAIESADMVIMDDSLSRIPTAIAIAKKTIRIAKENIYFALGIKFLFLILAALGYSYMWMAIIADVGVTILAVMNSLRCLKAPKN